MKELFLYPFYFHFIKRVSDTERIPFPNHYLLVILSTTQRAQYLTQAQGDCTPETQIGMSTIPAKSEPSRAAVRRTGSGPSRIRHIVSRNAMAMSSVWF